MAWLPIFFMYFSASLSIKDVLILESIYYISVVILEIPSGYFSDKFGRRKTLIISSLFFTISYFLFGFLDPTFSLLVIAQLFLAGGMSFLSGTDTAFYYESLKVANLDNQYINLEAKVQTLKQIASAVAVLLGGFMGSISLQLGYQLSFIFVVPALIISWRFTEPNNLTLENKTNFLNQLKLVVNEVKKPELKWIFIFSINLFILAHVPYEFYQSYLQLLEKNDMSFGVHAAIYSGIVFSLTRLFGAYASKMSPHWMKKYGLKKLCITAIIFQILIIASMAFVLHFLIVLIILLRSFSMSLTAAPINAAIAPRVSATNRATYFSFQSLVSRLSYSVTLLFLSWVVGHQSSSWSSLSQILSSSLGLGIILLIPLIFMKSGTLFQKVETNQS